MTHSIDQTLHQFANLLPNWTLLPILTLLPNFGGFHRTLQRVRLANRGRLLPRTPVPVPFGTCICPNVETILSWTCHVYGPFESRTSLGTSILLYIHKWSCHNILGPVSRGGVGQYHTRLLVLRGGGWRWHEFKIGFFSYSRSALIFLKQYSDAMCFPSICSWGLRIVPYLCEIDVRTPTSLSSS